MSLWNGLIILDAISQQVGMLRLFMFGVKAEKSFGHFGVKAENSNMAPTKFRNKYRAIFFNKHISLKIYPSKLNISKSFALKKNFYLLAIKCAISHFLTPLNC